MGQSDTTRNASVPGLDRTGARYDQWVRAKDIICGSAGGLHGFSGPVLLPPLHLYFALLTVRTGAQNEEASHACAIASVIVAVAVVLRGLII
eukprot:25716-Pelagomonas_calceolata.AAC.8